MQSSDDDIQRFDLKPSFSNHNLFEQVLRRENLQSAWKQVRANKGAAGIDGMTIEEFPAWAKSGEWALLVLELENGSYKPSSVRRVEIEKPDGGTRQLGIPTVTVRVIQQVISQVLTPIFDPLFSESSFGFRSSLNYYSYPIMFFMRLHFQVDSRCSWPVTKPILYGFIFVILIRYFPHPRVCL